MAEVGSSEDALAAVVRRDNGTRRSAPSAHLTPDLLALRAWLLHSGCTHVGMESTGVYWMPVYRRMESCFEVVVANAQHIKAVPGRKTDVQDAEWIADLRHAWTEI